MSRLVDVFLLALDDLDDGATAWLQHQGIPDIALDMWPGPVGVAAIETHPLGIFDFAEHGHRAFIQPVLSGGEFTDIADLIAWYPDKPAHWWTHCYTGLPLGIDQLDRAEIEGFPLSIRPTPLSWLQAGGDGVVITDWAMSATALRCCRILIGKDPAHGDDIERRLRNPSGAFPEIRIMKSKLEAV